MRILLVDDNPLNRSVAARLLEHLGHQAEVVANGVEAVAKVMGQKYDVVLMDVDMPVMDGLAATREIRSRIPADQGPPIIALTAHSAEEDRQVCLDAGMNGLVQKPFRLEQLAQVLNAYASVPTGSD